MRTLLITLFKTLKNTCRLKYSQLKGEEVYPKTILPDTRFINRISINNLLEEQNYLIVRVSRKSIEDTFNRLGKLRADIVTVEDMVNMSVNLLGGLFDLSHIKFFPGKLGRRPWTNEKVRLADFVDDYTVERNCAPIILEPRKFHGKSIPFSVKSENKHAVKRIKNVEPNAVPVDGNYLIHGTVSLVHVPTMLNYWHAEIQMLDFEGKQVNRADNALNAFACNHLLISLFQEHKFVKDRKIPNISKTHYKLN